MKSPAVARGFPETELYIHISMLANVCIPATARQFHANPSSY